MIKLLLALAMAWAAPLGATTFSLTVSTQGPLSLSSVTATVAGMSNPAQQYLVCGSTCTAIYYSTYTVTLTAVPGSTNAFAGWGGADGCPTNSLTCSVPMSAARVMTAQFLPLLSLQLYGNGTGTVTDSSGVFHQTTASQAPWLYPFYPGSHLKLAATPLDSTSTFTGWTGVGGCSTSSTCAFTLNGYTVLVATFSSAGPFLLTTVVNGPGTVTSSPAGIKCPGTCSAWFSANTSVSLATAASSGHTFTGWANGFCSGSTTACVMLSTSSQQEYGGAQSPWATFQ
jgi:hypothetical protein